jgi:hypothetical protein
MDKRMDWIALQSSKIKIITNGFKLDRVDLSKERKKKCIFWAFYISY